ncbi:MAG: hypothetical protein WD360_01165 [Nitriliruptoraceae bacterium]
MNLSCASCATVGVLHVGLSASVDVNGITVAMNSPPVVHCPNGHQLPPSGMVAVARAAIRHRIGQARHGLRDREHCTACRTALSMPPRWTQIPVTIETPAVATLTLGVPATRCPNCGLDQLSKRAAGDLDTAVQRLFSV